MKMRPRQMPALDNVINPKNRVDNVIKRALGLSRPRRTRRRALRQWPRRTDFLYGEGVVRAIDSHDVHLDVLNLGGKTVEVDLPKALADHQDLKVGSEVMVWCHLTGRRATLELLPAVEAAPVLNTERPRLRADALHCRQCICRARRPAPRHVASLEPQTSPGLSSRGARPGSACKVANGDGRRSAK